MHYLVVMGRSFERLCINNHQSLELLIVSGFLLTQLEWIVFEKVGREFVAEKILGVAKRLTSEHVKRQDKNAKQAGEPYALIELIYTCHCIRYSLWPGEQYNKSRQKCP